MKVTVNVDCTPEEARAFFGLPDVAPMQEAVLNEVQDRILKNMAAMDVDTLMRVWLPKSSTGGVTCEAPGTISVSTVSGIASSEGCNAASSNVNA